MNGNLIWLDMEITGLDPAKMVILEIASIITDSELNILAEGPNIVINHPEEILSNMEEWSLTQHTSSGLLELVRSSSHDCAYAERETLKFISSYSKKGESLLCGNSIWQDRRFLARYMPDLENYFHYRMIDVSTLKELAARWYPRLPVYEKRKAHLALSDIHESINELKYYRERLFIKSGKKVDLK